MHVSATDFSLFEHEIVTVCSLDAIRAAGQGCQAKKLNTWFVLNLSLYRGECYNNMHTTKQY